MVVCGSSHVECIDRGGESGSGSVKTLSSWCDVEKTKEDKKKKKRSARNDVGRRKGRTPSHPHGRSQSLFIQYLAFPTQTVYLLDMD